MKNSLLYAVKSCEKDCLRGDHWVIRNTWGSDLIDLRFFLGRGCQMFDKDLLIDEVRVSAPDDYDGLPFKTREILRWFLTTDYEHVFLCDTDSYVIPRLLLQTEFRKYDLSGRFGAMPPLGSTFNYRDARGAYPNCWPWPSGGCGYALSRKAAEVISNSEIKFWAEDMQVGNCLGPLIQSGEIRGLDIPNFEGQIAWHFPRRMYDNKVYDPALGWMEKMYAEYH